LTPEKDQTIAKLLEDSQDMLKRFESLSGKDSVEQISADVQKVTLEAFETGLEPTADGYFDLFVEEDGMSAVAEFRPPSGDGKPLSLDRIERALAECEVVHGVLWDEISRGMALCNQEHQHLQGAVVARGTAPVPFQPEHIRLEDRWTTRPATDLPDGRAVNFKEINPFLVVKKGELLARRIPEASGSPGTDVLGREIPFPTTKVPRGDPGPHVVETPAGFEAELDGRLVLTPSAFSVNPVLELKEGVDYKTGHIRFKGEVVVSGRVLPGFSIEAGGGLTCRDVLDAFQVKVGTDLTTPSGIIGNGEGRVDVGGGVTAKFLEHLYLLAQGDIRVEACILNSVVKTRGSLTMAERGILAGGQIHVLNGVELFQIGTATGPNTELFVGLDFQGMEHIRWIRDRTKELQDQLRKVDGVLPYGGTRVHDLMEAAKKLRVEILQLTETARSQLMHLGQNEEAEVVVRGSVYPGTHIEICHMQFQVNQKLSSVRFSLDKRKGIVAVAPLNPPLSKDATHSGSSPKKR